MKPGTECFCQSNAAVSSSSEAPFLRENRPRRISFLLPAFGSAFVFFRAFFADFGFFGDWVPGTRFALVVPPCDSTGVSSAGTASFWTSTKMCLAATARLVNFFIGVTPVRLFQISNQPLVVRADKLGKVFGSIEDAGAGLAGGLARGVNGDVVI